MRPTAPGATRWLEWGHETPDGRKSAVRDAEGAMLFTGSSVRLCDTTAPLGTIAELLTEHEVQVTTHGGGSTKLRADRLVLVPDED